MIELPPLPDIATAFVFVGALFVLRFVLALHRLRKEAGLAGGFSLADFARVRRPGAFGEDREPERRHAARQLLIGFGFFGFGVGLFAFLLATSLFGFGGGAPRLA